jgi:hypothetical protein
MTVISQKGLHGLGGLRWQRVICLRNMVQRCLSWKKVPAEAEAESSIEKVWVKYKKNVQEKKKFHTVFGKKRIADGSDDFSFVETDND